MEGNKPYIFGGYIGRKNEDYIDFIILDGLHHNEARGDRFRKSSIK